MAAQASTSLRYWWMPVQANSSAKSKLLAQNVIDVVDRLFCVLGKLAFWLKLQVLAIVHSRRIKPLHALQALRHAEACQRILRAEPQSFFKALASGIVIVG